MEQNTEERKEAIHPIHTWWLSQEKMDDIKIQIREKILADVQFGIDKKLEEMKAHIQQLPPNTFIPVKEAPFVFSTNPVARLLVEDVDRLKLGLAYTCYDHDDDYEAGDEEKLPRVGSAAWALCRKEEADHLCGELEWRMDLKRKIDDYQSYSKRFDDSYWNDHNVRLDQYGLTLRGKNTYYRFGDRTEHYFYSGERRLVADLYVAPVPEEELSLPYILSNGFTPQEVNDSDFWRVLSLLISADWINLKANEENTGYDLEYNEGDISVESLRELAKGMKQGNLLKSYFQIPEADEMEKQVEETFKKSSIPYADLFADVLNRDKVRCDLPVYPMRMLTDPNRGSWDLWETERPNHEGETHRDMEKSFYARDPRQDISSVGVIGIDFGTKSTVVTNLEDTNVIRPLRIGTGELDTKPRETDYENPTVMEFTDIDRFLKTYQAREGKPDTRWADLDISHTAANNWEH